ncbi:50S ribosomal protein L24 [bacterium]|nr:50S ribosomal protein L24 [bacterium]
MKIKKGDTVKVLSGKDRGKTGKVLRTFPSENKVVVEGIGMVKKHLKPSNTRAEGEILEIEARINVSKVMLLHDGKPTRIGFKFVEEDGKLVKKRIAKKSGAVI